ncbi:MULTISPECIES: hypothetical protein [unclassified Methylobacterium]|jgi:hypothetical protein|uniref:hypothetical protein n=1 Tax=unclassified Methylobacterium TaxID=2615210 RepID=UPI00135454BA|nr:hypothetical protein [Methylobacterium sp. 2A]MWV23452.1 hypothetical protein [Methylobacterium sp. 2A]
MTNTAADIAALKILVIELYGAVATKEGSPEKARQFIDRMMHNIYVGIEKAKADYPVDQHDQIDDVHKSVAQMLGGMEFGGRDDR